LANIAAIKIMQRAGRDPSVNQRRWNSRLDGGNFSHIHAYIVFVMKCRNAAAEMGPFACIRCFDLRSLTTRVHEKQKTAYFYQHPKLSRRQQREEFFLIKNFISRASVLLFLSLTPVRSRYQKEATNFQLERRFRENDDQLVALAKALEHAPHFSILSLFSHSSGVRAEASFSRPFVATKHRASFDTYLWRHFIQGI
jgi:hypothetical protein